jgi:hypothetical protein
LVAINRFKVRVAEVATRGTRDVAGKFSRCGVGSYFHERLPPQRSPIKTQMVTGCEIYIRDPSLRRREKHDRICDHVQCGSTPSNRMLATKRSARGWMPLTSQAVCERQFVTDLL